MCLCRFFEENQDVGCKYLSRSIREQVARLESSIEAWNWVRISQQNTQQVRWLWIWTSKSLQAMVKFVCTLAPLERETFDYSIISTIFESTELLVGWNWRILTPWRHFYFSIFYSNVPSRKWRILSNCKERSRIPKTESIGNQGLFNSAVKRDWKRRGSYS